MALRLSTGFRNMQVGINTDLLADNGAMTTDAAVQAYWTETTATMLGGVSHDGHTCMSLGTAGGYARAAALTVKVGHVYKFTYDYKEGGAAGDAQVTLGTAAGGTQIYDSGALTTAAWTSKEFFFTATTTAVHISLINTSTGVQYFDNVKLVCMSRSYQDAFRYAQIKWYTGSQPASPDDVPTGTLVCTMKNGVTGMTFDDAVSGVLQKPAGETWSGVCEAAGGTVGWARLTHVDDTGASSTTEARVDFRVSTSGAEANFESVAWGGGSTQSISSLPITRPMSA